MEENISFNSDNLDANALNTVQLAYLGDAIYEIYIRNYLLSLGITKSAGLQKNAEALVKAKTQSDALSLIIPALSESEKKIVLRARNNKHKNKPRSATVEEYNNATALEALIGYLYLNKHNEKLDEIIEIIIKTFGGKQ